MRLHRLICGGGAGSVWPSGPALSPSWTKPLNWDTAIDQERFNLFTDLPDQALYIPSNIYLIQQNTTEYFTVRLQES